MSSITTIRTQTIDSVITYFETELDMVLNQEKNTEEENRFLLNMFVLMFSTIIVGFSGASQIFAEQKNVLLSIMIILIVIMVSGFLIFFANIKSNSSTNFEKKTCLQLILKYLLHLKATRIDINKYLGELKEKIKTDFRDRRLVIDWNVSLKNIVKSQKKYELDRLKEYITILDNINATIVKDDIAKQNYRSNIKV